MGFSIICSSSFSCLVGSVDFHVCELAMLSVMYCNWYEALLRLCVRSVIFCMGIIVNKYVTLFCVYVKTVEA